jgi:hypothetical protein
MQLVMKLVSWPFRSAKKIVCASRWRQLHFGYSLESAKQAHVCGYDLDELNVKQVRLLMHPLKR